MPVRLFPYPVLVLIATAAIFFATVATLWVLQPHVSEAANFNVAAGDTAGLVAAINAANNEAANPGPDIITLVVGTQA